MYLLNGRITLVYIIELQFLLIEQQVFHLIGIVAGIVLKFCHHQTFHGDIERLLGTVALDGCHLMETTELSGIVGELDGELIPCPNLFGERHIGTAAIGFHALDMQTAMASVTEFEGGGNGLHITGTATLHDGLVDGDPLRGCI